MSQHLKCVIDLTVLVGNFQNYLTAATRTRVFGVTVVSTIVKQLAYYPKYRCS